MDPEITSLIKEFGLPLTLLLVSVSVLWRKYNATSKAYEEALKEHAKDMKESADRYHVTIQQIKELTNTS